MVGMEAMQWFLVIRGPCLATFASMSRRKPQCFQVKTELGRIRNILGGKGPGLDDGGELEVPDNLEYSSDGCLEGWIKHGDKCFFLNKAKKNWNFAEDTCSKFNVQMN